MRDHWHEEEGLRLTSFGTRRCDNRGSRCDNAAVFLCIVLWCRAIGYVRKKSFAAAVLRNQVGPPGNCTNRGTGRTWPAYSHSTAWEWRVWRGARGKVTGTTYEDDQGERKGWMWTGLNRWNPRKGVCYIRLRTAGVCPHVRNISVQYVMRVSQLHDGIIASAASFPEGRTGNLTKQALPPQSLRIRNVL
jgi:hypothetical protein